MSRLMDDPEVYFAGLVVIAVAVMWHDTNGTRSATDTLHKAIELFDDTLKRVSARERLEKEDRS